MILAVTIVLTTVVSAGYYLPVIMSMYMKAAPSEESHVSTRLWPAGVGAVIASVVAVVLFGIWPAGVLDVAGRSGATLIHTAQPVMNSSGGETVNGKR
jgi:NADH:ubiquinone oxidoreductase subunit 2 (subunit N)